MLPQPRFRPLSVFGRAELPQPYPTRLGGSRGLGPSLSRYTLSRRAIALCFPCIAPLSRYTPQKTLAHPFCLIAKGGYRRSSCPQVALNGMTVVQSPKDFWFRGQILHEDVCCKISGPQKGLAERGHVKKSQKSLKNVKTNFYHPDLAERKIVSKLDFQGRVARIFWFIFIAVGFLSADSGGSFFAYS